MIFFCTKEITEKNTKALKQKLNQSFATLKLHQYVNALISCNLILKTILNIYYFILKIQLHS